MGTDISFNPTFKEKPANASVLKFRINCDHRQEPLKIRCFADNRIRGLGKREETHQAVKTHVSKEGPAVAQVLKQPWRAAVQRRNAKDFPLIF